ncbi:MAG: hypothetical protein K2I95_06590 [Treponemataceae bacterium]|nr:hypothetical protein [Treponemataceae bacterium]
MFRAFQQKARFCTNLCEEDVLRLRQSAGLLEDETVCLLICAEGFMPRRLRRNKGDETRVQLPYENNIPRCLRRGMLIDDSLFGNRAKNVILTDRRILWQEKRRAPYRSVSLSALKGASVFAGQRGSASVITILNGSECVSLIFKNVRECEPLRIIFHDYLSRYCEGYNPLDEENARRYEKEFLLPQRKRDLISAVLAAAGGVFFLLFALIQQRAVFSRLLKSLKWSVCHRIEGSMVALSLICWAANIILPASKSKILKSALLFMSTIYFIILFVSPSFSWWDYAIGSFFAVVFLLADRFDDVRLELVVIGFTVVLALFFASLLIIRA